MQMSNIDEINSALEKIAFLEGKMGINRPYNDLIYVGKNFSIKDALNSLAEIKETLHEIENSKRPTHGVLE